MIARLWCLLVSPAVGLMTALVGRSGEVNYYNLSVSQLHTYAVGNSHAVVHTTGCDEWAAAFATQSGGEIKTFTPSEGQYRGPYRPGGPGTPAVQEDWFYHTVVVRDGMVFDQWHPDGVDSDIYKQMFDYSDAIDFGF